MIDSLKESFTLLALGTSNGSIEFINKSGTVKNKIKDAHKNAIVYLRFANDTQTLVSSCTNSCVRLWSR